RVRGRCGIALVPTEIRPQFEHPRLEKRACDLIGGTRVDHPVPDRAPAVSGQAGLLLQEHCLASVEIRGDSPREGQWTVGITFGRARRYGDQGRDAFMHGAAAESPGRGDVPTPGCRHDAVGTSELVEAFRVRKRGPLSGEG